MRQLVVLLGLVIALSVCRGEYSTLVTSDGDEICGVYNPNFGKLPPMEENAKWMDVSVAEPEDGCSAQDGEAVTGTALVATRGECTFIEKAIEAEKAGADILVVQNTEDKYAMPSGSEEDDDYGKVNIPVMIVTQSDGEKLKSSKGLKVQAYDLDVQNQVHREFISSQLASAVIVVMALSIVTGGAILACKSESTQAPERTGGNSQPEQDDSPASVFVDKPLTMFMVMCCQMLFLYFLYEYLVHVIIIFFCIGCTAAISMVLRDSIKSSSPTVLRISYLDIAANVWDLLCFGIGLGISVTWYIFRHSNWAWILQNIMGTFLMLLVLQTLKLPSMKVSSILLVCLFFYDIFFVFITPLFTKTGESVMEKVAVGTGLKERMPMMISIPYLFAPNSTCLGARGSSMMGYGDIIVPGIFIVFMHSLDLKIMHANPGNPQSNSYFSYSVYGYAAGLILTNIALRLMNTAQPALLWIVPSVLASVSIAAVRRGELKPLWTDTLVTSPVPEPVNGELEEPLVEG